METKGNAVPRKSGRRYWYLKGMRDGLPIAMGYFAVAFTMGITAKNIGMTPLQSALMSITMLASAGQFAAMTVIAAGAGCLEMAVTTVIVNLRYLLMSCALSQKVGPQTGMGHRMLLSYCITDEIFGVEASVEGRLNPFYPYGMATVAAPGWTLGTFLGASLGAILPLRAANAMNVALYGMFLAVIIPPAKKDKVIASVVVVSMLASYLFSVTPVLCDISSGFRMIILTVVIAGIAAKIKPISSEVAEMSEGSEPSEMKQTKQMNKLKQTAQEKEAAHE